MAAYVVGGEGSNNRHCYSEEGDDGNKFHDRDQMVEREVQSRDV